MSNVNEKLYIGIDGGGSKCKAVLTDSGINLLGEGLGGPANPFYGLERTLNSIVDASTQALESANLPGKKLSDLVVGMGLAGVNLPELYKQITDWKHPFAKLYLTTDVDIANIGAHSGKDGGVIIVGTGSIGFASIKGKQRMLGGHGFPIGDVASGAWIGLRAIEHAILADEDFEEKGELATKICKFYDVHNGLGLSEKLIGKASSEYARIASIVFEASDNGDKAAEKIINAGMAYIQQLAAKLFDDESERLAMIGGLTQFYMPRLPKEVASLFSETLAQPEIGAVHLAMHREEKDNA